MIWGASLVNVWKLIMALVRATMVIIVIKMPADGLKNAARMRPSSDVRGCYTSDVHGVVQRLGGATWRKSLLAFLFLVDGN